MNCDVWVCNYICWSSEIHIYENNPREHDLSCTTKGVVFKHTTGTQENTREQYLVKNMVVS